MVTSILRQLQSKHISLSQFIFWVFLLIHLPLFGQSPAIKSLESKIYELNNNAKYVEARNLVQAFLEARTITNEDRFYAFLQMSFIYKRLFDYASNLRYLDSALIYGMRTDKPDFFIANTKAQKALALFDTHRYEESAVLMAELSAINYKHLDIEYTAKIIMQEGFLAYLRKDFNTAKKKYDTALSLLLRVSPCDAPMIYAKQIKLFVDMKDYDTVRKVYKLSIQAADSCGIDKYGIYTRQELLDALTSVYGYSNLIGELDSLNQKYSTDKYLREIQAIEEFNKLRIKDVVIQTQQRQNLILGISAFLMFIALLALGYFYLALKRQKDFIEQQNDINEYTISILSHDIKEPLLGVRLLLKKLKIEDAYLAQASQSLEKQVAAVNSILQNLLRLRKLNFQDSKDKESTNTAEAIKSVVGELNLVAKEKNIHINIALKEDQTLPIAREKLQIIVHNLLSNALKYSFKNEHIDIFSTEEGICIQDYGVGIQEADKNALLAAVNASKEGTNQERGAGLGLYLVGRMIKESPLDIAFEAAKPQGTAVYVNRKN